MKKMADVITTRRDESRLPEHCPYCGKELYYYVLVKGTEIIPLPGAELCDCPQSKEQQKKEINETIQEIRKKEELETIERLFRQSNLGARFMRRTFDNFDRSRNSKAFDIAYNYAINFPSHYENGKGLIFLGPCGTGKTHLAAAIANYLIKNYQTGVIFGTFSKLLENLRASYQEDEEYENLMFRLETVSLLIIDDLGKEKLTDWTLEKAYDIVNARYENMKPIVITTNFTLKQLEDRLNSGGNMIGEALVSRLIEMCDIIAMNGGDYRKQ